MSRCLVIGGAGQLGRVLVSQLVAAGIGAVSLDYAANQSADTSIVVDSAYTLPAILGQLGESAMLDGVVCVAGGWASDTALSPTLLDGEMWRRNVQPSLLAAAIAAHRLKSSGVIVLTAAKAALGPTPTMLTYGMAKAAVIHLTQSLAAGSLAGTVLALLPEVLDTPSNRQAMPSADTDNWTRLDVLAARIVDYVKGDERPRSGSLVGVVTRGGRTVFSDVGGTLAGAKTRTHQ